MWFIEPEPVGRTPRNARKTASGEPRQKRESHWNEINRKDRANVLELC